MKRVFISAEHTTKTVKENRDNTMKLKRELTAIGVTFNYCDSMFEGVREKSFVVNLETPRDMSRLVSLAEKFGQDCILAETSRNDAVLFWNNGNVEFIGKMVRVPSTMGLTAYSIVNGKIYTVK